MAHFYVLSENFSWKMENKKIKIKIKTLKNDNIFYVGTSRKKIIFILPLKINKTFNFQF